MPVLPRPSGNLTISSFDRRLDQAADVLDLRTLRFVDAYGLIGLACALRLAGDASKPVPVQVPTEKSMRSHLTAMGFRDFLATAGQENLLPAVPTIDAPDVVVPLRPARDSGGAQALSHVIWEQLRDHVDPQGPSGYHGGSVGNGCKRA